MMMADLPDPKLRCHRTGFLRSCRALVSSGKCGRWMQVQGTHPQTGVQFAASDCVDNWGPTLMIENSKMQRETGAAIESFRNEMVRLGAPGAAPAVEYRPEAPVNVTAAAVEAMRGRVER